MWSDVDKLKSKISGAEKKFGLKTKLVGAAAAMQGALGGLAGDLGTAFRVPIVLTAQEDSTVRKNCNFILFYQPQAVSNFAVGSSSFFFFFRRLLLFSHGILV